VATVVIPFAGTDGKTRLHVSRRVRRALSLAMLGDVLAAALAVGAARVVTGDAEGAQVAREAGADVVDDPGGGQGPAVAFALEGVEPGATLVVNSDVPCAVPADLRALLAATPAGGLALVEALDGTTNALSISAAPLFAPVYGRDSAARFRAHARGLGLDAISVVVPNLSDDVDTMDDLKRLHLRLGPRSQALLAALPVEELA
jgi:2-phospho-L-lactate guanylyltransferase